MFCTKCGNQIPDGSAVCPICGAQFAAPQPAPQPAPQMAPQMAPQAPQQAPVAPVSAPKAKKAGGSKLPLIIGAVAAVAVIAVVLVLLLSGGPKSVVKDYLNLSEDISQAKADRDKKITKLQTKQAELMMENNAKARKALKLDKDKDSDKDVEMTWEITDSESYGEDDKPFKGLVFALEKGLEANVKSVSKMAIVEVKFYDKNDKKNDDKTSYQYFSLAKISGSWYILDVSDKMKAKNDPKIKSIANEWESYIETSSK